MKRFCPLASGSKGNCLYLETGSAKILVDVGLSAKATRDRLAKIDVDIHDIDAILVTHEHSDHMRGLEVLAAGKHKIPVFANGDTAKAICGKIKKIPPFKIFSTGETFEFEDLQIHPFSVQHDTFDPVMFTFLSSGIKLGVCTDLGFVTTLVRSHLQNCDYLYIEANHEPSMVHACPRPMIYKQRVLGRQGHISNETCAELLKEISHKGLKHVYLAHLSEECNNPDVALEKVRKSLPDHVTLSIAYQHKLSQIIEG
ncbi:MAG: MBL fold metallo-hydrolase [Simkaniaceae bacterium]|nr:MBL fold metallo-hydrolase [Simkaniaceae bacterium]